jgi:hypothetical protein
VDILKGYSLHKENRYLGKEVQMAWHDTEIITDVPTQESSIPQLAAYSPRRRSDVRMRIIEGETVVLDRHGGLIHQFNQTASYIWERCDGKSTTVEIAQQLAEAFDVHPTTAADDVAGIVQRLQELNLLEPSAERPVPPTLEVKE